MLLTELTQLLRIPPRGPLNGILVAEICQHVSGPTAGEELARQGALVVKIEQPGGDPSRQYLSKELFTNLNAAKASIEIDKINPSDLVAYQEILSLADVILDNRSPDAKDRDTILQEFLTSDNRRHPVIFCSIVGFNSEESRDKLALDVSVQAETGMFWINAPDSQNPLKVGFAVIDFTVGYKAASYICAHLVAIKNTSPPKNSIIKIEVSMAKAAAALQCGQFLNYVVRQKDEFRNWNRDIFLAPFSSFKTLNGDVSLAVIDENQFKKLCIKILKNESLIIKFPSNQARMNNIVELEAEINAVLNRLTTEELIDDCKRFGIVCSKVNKISELEKEPYYRSLFNKTTEGTIIISDTAVNSIFPELPMHPAPDLNQNNRGILALLTFVKLFDIHTFSTVDVSVATGKFHFFSPSHDADLLNDMAHDNSRIVTRPTAKL